MAKRRPKPSEVAELRALMLGPLKDRMGRVERWLSDRNAFINDVSDVLPRAIAQRPEEDRSLTLALMPAVEDAVQTSVKRNPKPLIDAIFPIIGPAIRKAIAQAMGGLLEGINKNVEAVFTPRGIKWRFEAWRKKKSYAEIVLAHSIVYRVEQAYLIHQETGLLLHHLGPLTPQSEDPDVVSSMFTAIQDFVRDAFPTGGGGSLDQAQVGDMTLVGEYGPRALLVLVVRGVPPKQLSVLMQKTIEKIHVEWLEELTKFQGDNTPFRATEPLLENLLVDLEKPKRRNWAGPIVLTAAAAGIVLLLLSWMLKTHEKNTRWEEYLSLLDKEPGYFVMSSGEEEGRFSVRALRDPLAADYAGMLDGTGLEPDSVRHRFETFYSADREIVIRRATGALEPPPDVTFALDGQTLVVEGFGPRRWFVEAARRAPFLPGITHVRAGTLLDDSIEGWAGQVRAALVFFDAGESVLSAEEGDMLAEVAKALHRLDRLAQRENREVLVDLVGRVGPTEEPADASALRNERATVVAERLNREAWLTTKVRIGRSTEHVTTPWIPKVEEGAGRIVGVWFAVRTPAKGGR